MIKLTTEQETFRRAVAKFVDAEVVPAAEAIDERAEFPTKLFRRLGELGYLGLRYPEAYGGADADMVTYCLFAEELARGSLSVAAAAGMQSLMGTYFVYKYGSEELRRRYLVPALRGDLIATFALTEPSAGSDVASITTRARSISSTLAPKPARANSRARAPARHRRPRRNVERELLPRAAVRQRFRQRSMWVRD